MPLLPKMKNEALLEYINILDTKYTFDIKELDKLYDLILELSSKTSFSDWECPIHKRFTENCTYCKSITEQATIGDD